MTVLIYFGLPAFLGIGIITGIICWGFGDRRW